jgi:hypothetical protein
MGVPPAKLHEKPAKANKWGTRSEHAAGFFDPVAPTLRLAESHEKLCHQSVVAHALVRNVAYYSELGSGCGIL